MFRHILVPTDGSPLALAAVEKAVEFAKDTNADITFVSVTEPSQIASPDSEALASTRAEYNRLASLRALQFLTEAEKSACEEGVACEGVRIECRDICDAITDIARARGCDLIAMASHGQGGMNAVLLGSVTTKILAHSKIPVLIYR